LPKGHISPRKLELVAKPRESVLHHIVDFIEHEIVTGTLKPGDRLKAERELSLQLNVSRNSLREAFRYLEMLGLVEIQHGQGVFVKIPEPSIFARFFNAFLSVQPGGLSDVLDARICLETHGAKLACRVATEADLHRMQEAYEAMTDAADRLDGSAMAAADFAFHNVIMNSTGNQVLIFLYSSIRNSLSALHRERWLQVSKKADFQHRLILHVPILSGIKARNEENATSAMIRHFSESDRYT
jgi:GntR family transcriptional regulator, transcriptional repressor for pyruvate dehydrogenase complex